MKKLVFLFSLLMSLTISTVQLWAATKTEGFETATAGSNYQSTVTVSTTQSDCGISWEIYYGTVSTSSKISGNNSAALRLYTTNNYGYLKTNTALNGLTQVSFKAKAATTNSASIKIDVKYSTDGTNWSPMKLTSASGNNYTAQSVASSATNYTAYVPSGVTGDVYFQIAINSGSTKPSSKNAQLTIDDVVFTYTPAVSGECTTPTFSPVAGTYEGTQNVTIRSTDEATIYYTTDGTTPTTSSSVYSSAIPVSANTTIKAFATKSGLTDSQVGEATYTITKGPDVTLDFTSNTNWNFPNGQNNIEESENSFTNGDYTIKVAGSSGKGYYFNSGKLLIGQSGAYIVLPTFETPIEKIVCPGVSGASGKVTWNVYKGTTAVCSEVTGCTTDQTFEFENPEENNQYTIRITNANNLQISKIKIYFGAASAVAKPTISGATTFINSTAITLGCATNGATIYYTTDGSDPKNGTTYTDPFTLSASATIKAIAKVGSDWSAVAEKDFEKVIPLTTMAAVQAAATSTESSINVSITNWIVTAVSNSQVWIADADNAKGLILYKTDHGFSVGNKLNGNVVGTKIKLYNNYPELTSLLASELTITTADAITPRTTTIAALTSGFPAEQGTIVKLENLTYSSSSFSDGTNTITIDTRFYNPTLVDGSSYNLTGVVMYGNNSVIKIMPRLADDIEQLDDASLTEVSGLAELKAENTGSYIVNLTNAIVTLVDGNNAFIEDASAGALIYFSNHGYTTGDCLNGKYEVTTALYNGKFEITAMAAQEGAAKTTAAIPVTTLTLAQLSANFAANESRRIKIEGVNVTDAIATDDRNGVISDGINTFALYAGKNGIAATINSNIDVIGYPTFFNENHQLSVWAQTDITVNEKENPEISWSASTVRLAVGGEFTAPSLTNPHGLNVTITSNNTNLATVTNGVVSLVENATGTATITATFTGNATYNSASVSYTIIVSDGSTDYVVILAQYDGKWYAMKNTGITNNTAAALEVTYSEGKIWDLSAEEQDEIIWMRTIDGDNVTFQAPNNDYLKTSSNNLSMGSGESGNYQWTWNETYYRTGTQTRTFVYRGGTINGFRSYAVSNAGKDDYSTLPIVTSVEFMTFQQVRSGLDVGRHYTICLPKKIIAVRGATFWGINNGDATAVYMELQQPPFEAGTPFIFYATANTLEVVYEGDVVTEPVPNGALRGTLSYMNHDALVAAGSQVYLMYSNALHPLGTNDNHLDANRAYLLFEELQAGAPAPGRQVKRMPLQTDVTTGFEDAEASAQPKKMLIDGQLFIRCGEKLYNATGSMVK